MKKSIPCAKKHAVPTLTGLLIFAAFFMLLSPFYVYRTIILKLRYSSPSGTEISVSGMRYPADAFSGKFYTAETFSLPASASPRTVLLELPVENRVGGFRMQFPRRAYSFRLSGAALVNHGRKYPVAIKNCICDHESSSRVAKTADILTVKRGNGTSVCFLCDDYMRVNRSWDPVMAFYCALIALLPAMLAYSGAGTVRSLKDIGDLVYSAAALLLLTFPVLLMDYYGIISDENRRMAPFPELLVHHRFNSDFPRQFEAWFADRFAGRKSAIQNEKKVFSPHFGGNASAHSARAFCGKENWMFLGNRQCVEMFRNQNRFSEKQLKICAENVSALNRFCAAKKIKLYIMLTPDKERVYPEFYPDRYRPVHSESRLEQLYRYLSRHTPVKIIFPLYELREAKKQYPVYFKTGSHWTPRGACIAGEMLLKELQKDFPGIPADQPNAERWNPSFAADVDIAHMLGYADPRKQLPPEILKHDAPEIRCGYGETFLTPPGLYSSTLNQFTAIVPRKNGLKLFACTDSFWAGLMPFLFPASNQMLHAYYGDGNPFELAPYKAFLEEFAPDAMVIESTERFLDRFLTLGVEGE